MRFRHTVTDCYGKVHSRIVPNRQFRFATIIHFAPYELGGIAHPRQTRSLWSATYSGAWRHANQYDRAYAYEGFEIITCIPEGIDMSYCYDTLEKAWATLRGHLPQEIVHGELAVRFEFLINEMHEANHRLKDAINKDARVTNCARQLDKVMEG